MLMIGPPGAGKSMLAQRLPSILPPLNARELLDVSMIQSIAGELADGALSDRRPFRAPHHSASMAALVGGGLRIRPGEVSLAHNGVLFLDELPEFQPAVLDSLRQPLEAGETVIARANARVTFPARFQLIAAMNPCKCGLAGTPGHTCRRGDACRTDYQSRVSGPFLDRIDLRIDVPAVTAADMIGPASAEPSAAVAQRVEKARDIQRERYLAEGEPAIFTNAAAGPSLIERVVNPDKESQSLLLQAADRFNLSARAYHRVLKVARTLADLAGVEKVGRPHIAEALSYRLNFALA
jgi:magnesium chelatase family protein